MYIFYVRVWNSEVVPSNKQNSSHLLENAGNISQNLLLEKSKEKKIVSVWRSLRQKQIFWNISAFAKGRVLNKQSNKINWR